MTEIWFCPADESRIEEIFNAVKHCQSLHPDIEGKLHGNTRLLLLWETC